MNSNELELISSWYRSETDEEKMILFLAEKFGLKMVCVTKGEHGAVLYTEVTFFVRQVLR